MKILLKIDNYHIHKSDLINKNIEYYFEMNVKLVPIIEIINSSGTVLFKYPQYTLLDKIVDVWKIIIKYYYDYKPFIIGKYSGKYEGYHLITHEECKSSEFVSLLSFYYKTNHGVTVLDKIDRSFVWNDNKAFSIDNISIQCCRAGPNELTRLCYGLTKTDIKNEIYRIKTGEITTTSVNPITGLFVLNNLFFPVIPDEPIAHVQQNSYLYLDYL